MDGNRDPIDQMQVTVSRGRRFRPRPILVASVYLFSFESPWVDTPHIVIIVVIFDSMKYLKTVLDFIT